METPTNADIMERVEALEQKVDDLLDLVQQANGAWMLIKIIGMIAVGFASVMAAIHNWWQK